MHTLGRHRSDFEAFALYLLLTLFLTWPMPLQMSTHLAGNSNDVFINPWANWWTEKTLREGGDLYFTTHMFYPYGVSLTLHSFSHLNTFFWFILRPLMGTLAAYNATVLLTYVLSGYAMFSLVRHLTGSARAAFIAGLVFAFSPYHMIESAHPVIGTTQWLPLFLLFLIKTIQGKPRKIGDTALMVLFLWLTGLSSWHLFFFAVLLALTYAVYSLFVEHHRWDRQLFAYLIGAGVACAMLLSPLWYPIVREQLFTRTPYLAASIDVGESNDVLAFFVPSRYHPVLGAFTAKVSERFGLAAQRPAYLGLTAFVLAIVALKARRRAALYWGLAGLLFVVLSLGPYVQVYGVRLNTWPLPWAAPIVGLFRHPFRFNILISFCLAVLAGWGMLHLLASERGRRMSLLLTASFAAVITFEYLTIPLPRTQVNVSAFYESLAQQPDDFALVEVPIGRQPDKEYLYYQTIHGKRLVNGVVSRTPKDAYRFVNEVPLLTALRADEPPAWPERHLAAQLAPLADKNVRYIILHQKGMDPDHLNVWRDYFAFPPVFEDDRLIVYKTRLDSTVIARPTPELTLAWVGVPQAVQQGATFSVDAVWQTEAALRVDWEAQVQMKNPSGTIAQQVSFPLQADHPTSDWPANAAIRGEYTLQVDPHLAPGTYDLVLVLHPLPDGALTAPIALGTMEVKSIERVFTAPMPEHRADARFGDALSLLGYDVKRDSNALHVTLYWQALRRMDFYKVFVHVIDAQSGALLAQNDAAPRQSSYPTDWWESGEVVRDEIVLPLTGAWSNRYRIAVGVHEPDTLKRLPVQTQAGAPLGDHIELDGQP